MVQWAKDLALSLLWLRFHPQLWNLQVPWAVPKKKKKKIGIKLDAVHYSKNGLHHVQWARGPVKTRHTFLMAKPQLGHLETRQSL